MMKYDIRSKKNDKLWGNLYYDNVTNEFSLTLRSDIKMSERPPAYIQRVLLHTTKLESELAEKWLKSRLIAPDRENINEILISNNMPVYDILDMLDKSKGQSVADDIYINRVI